MNQYKKNWLAFFSIVLLACNEFEPLNPDTTNPTTGTNTTDALVPLSQLESPEDYTYDVNTANLIKLNGNAATVAGTGSKSSGGVVTISSAGTYKISGSLTNGQIIVKTDDKAAVKLILDGIDIGNTSTSPIFVDKATKVILILPKNSQNKITDGTNYTAVAEGQNAAIYSQTYLAITGEGNLQVNANFADGISSKDGLLINGGNITINAKDEGIRGKDFLVIRDGNFNVNTTNGDGFKADYDTDKSFGYVQIDKGTFKITTQGDAISAFTTLTINGGDFDIVCGGGSSKTVATGISAKAFKATVLVKLAANKANVSCADDGINSDNEVLIEKGTYAISSGDDGVHANNTFTFKDGDLNISKSIEGIEAKTITIEKGMISVVASNDAINATNPDQKDPQQNDGSMLNIKGGTIILNANGDCVDSNGSATMTDGKLIIHASNEPPLDYNGTFVVSKGFIIASGSGSNMLQAPSTSSTINSLKLTFTSANAANTLFNIVDEAGVSVVTFKPLKNYISVIFSSDKLIKDKKYTILTGGNVNETNTGGLFNQGTPSGGTQKGTFTVSSSVTTVKI